MSKAKAVGIGFAAVLALASPLVIRWEGEKFTPYRDSVGIWTVCVGHTGPDVIPGREYTKAECGAFYEADMAEANGYVTDCIGVPMLAQVEAALTSLVFNVGPKGVCGSSIQKYAKANNWPAACAGLDAWKFAGGRVLKGLVNRRADERYLCETGKYRWLN